MDPTTVPSSRLHGPVARVATASALALAALGVPAPADAHMNITSHTTRYGITELKEGPCGRAGGTRTNNVHTFTAGERITLVWEEFIAHPGYYRIAFDDDGDDDFVDPAGYDDLFTNDTVLRDGLFEHAGSGVDGPWSFEFALPDTPCDNCTLQLVQMMTDKPPYVVGTDDLYYQCIDLVLLPAEEPDAGPADAGADAGTGDTGVSDTSPEDAASTGDATADTGTVLRYDEGGGCAVTGSRGTIPGALVLLGFVALAGRRRRP